MFSFIRKRLSLKLLIPLCLVIIVGVGGLIIYVTDSTFEMAHGQAVGAAQDQSVSTARSLAMFINDQKTLATALGMQPTMLMAVKGDPWKAQELSEEIVKNSPTLWGMLVFDSKGVIVAGADDDGSSMVGIDIGARGYVKDALAGKSGGGMTETVLKSKTSGAQFFGVSYPIRNLGGEILGGVALFGSWDAFTEQFIAPIVIGSEGYGFILDRKGRLIYHPDKTQFGRDISGEDFVKQAMNMHDGVVEYDWEGREKMLAVSTDPTTGWIVCMSAYVEDIASVAVEQGDVMKLTGVGLVVTIMVLMHLLLTIFLFRPVNKAMDMADSTARGDLDEEFKVNEDGDEIDQMQVSLVNIRKTVSAMTADFSEVAERIQQGYLHTRGKADGFEGQYARLIDNTNRILDGLVSLLDELPLPVMSISKDHRIRYMNKAGAKIGGTSIGTLEGSVCSEYFKSGDCTPDNCACDKAMYGNEMVFSTTEARPGGAVMEIEYFGMPLVDEKNEVVGAIKVVMDQTEIRQAQRQMLETATQADELASMLSAASQELAAQVEQTTAGAERQRDMATEAASAMEEMSATVVEIAKNASNAATNSEEMRSNADKGGEVVTAVVKSIEELRGRAQVVDDNIRDLGNDVESIGAIMTVITDIADQTNLLALNAAIEAARAGDAGRGFAVVADEVRKLAEKTMDATHEVGNAIQSIQEGTRRNLEAFQKATEAIDQSTELASEAGGALHNILEGAKLADDQVRSIATASEQQAATSGEINRNVEEINCASDEIAGAMTQSTTAVTDLARLAEELQQITMRIGDGNNQVQ